MEWVTEVGNARENGVTDTIIDKTLASSEHAYTDMRTDDWMFFYADIFVEAVQYGGRTKLCDTLKDLPDDTPQQSDELVRVMVEYGANEGVNPSDYDSVNVIADTKVDVNGFARPWTYQYCTEYGFYQTPSHQNQHSMRSDFLRYDYWPKMCARSYEGLTFGKTEPRPKAQPTAIDQGGVSIAVNEIFFANGGEDPWRWVTQQESKPELGQVSVLSDCDDCAHCVELYTPSKDDKKELQQTRRQVEDWISKLLGKSKPEIAFLQ